MTTSSTHAISPNDTSFAGLDALLPDLERLYTDIHAHPELSMQETRTAGIAAQRLRDAGTMLRPASAKRASWGFCTTATVLS